MRILCLCDPQCCYLSHSILTGLHETGHEIWELPVLNSVRGGVDEGYDLPDGNRGYSATPGYLTANPLSPYPHQEVTAEVVNSCDLIVMLSTRDYAKRALRVICAMTKKEPRDLPLVLCEGEDYEWIDQALLSDIQPKVFFKRELSKQYSLRSYSGALGIPTFPLPFAAFTRAYPEIDDSIKTTDFYLSLGDTHQLRRDLVRNLLLARRVDSDFAKLKTIIACNSQEQEIAAHTDMMSPWTEYITKQAQSHMTAVVRGYGSDTLHCWEAFSFATGVIYFEPGIYIPYPFVNGSHCVTLSESDVYLCPKAVMRYRDLLMTGQIAKRGKEHCRRYHSTRARAGYLIDISMRTMGGTVPQYEEFGL